MRFFLLLLPFLSFAVTPPKDRLPSTPYISGDTFRFFADFAYDELDTSLDPASIQPGNTLFVKTDYLDRFFETIHPAIAHPYILITHNSDDPAPGPFAKFLDDPKLLAWFGQNYDGTPHPKIHPIPIGLANSHWKHGKFQKLAEVQAQHLAKKHLAYMNITIQTFSNERKLAYEAFAKAPFCYRKTDRTYEKFLNDVATSQFTVSPRGNGLDTHRLWEALYLGSIPIVKTSSLDPLYENLPVLIIDNWDRITEEFLQTKRNEIRQREYTLAPLLIHYWIDQINSCKISKDQ
jgi:hypothetical protein